LLRRFTCSAWTSFSIALRFVFVALFLTTAVPVFAWSLRAKITFAPIGRGPN